MTALGCPPDSPAAQRRLWQACDQRAAALAARFEGLHTLQRFDFVQPARLQPDVPARFRKPYATPVAYTAWGPADAPLLVCCGGVANTAMRFSFLAADLMGPWRVICMDWLGRGRSGWLADESEYTTATYVEQLRQLLAHLGGRPAALLGSSLGGTVAIEFAARHPRLVQRLVLNDVGPSIPAARRRRRAETLARFHVFRTPAELLRRVGAAHKNDGPVSDQVRLFLAYHQTRWSADDGGRVYRHDPRALQAYRSAARHSVEQWAAWAQVACPVLLLHGMASDALRPPTIARMQRSRPLCVAHIPHTGHTPVLCDRNQTHHIAHWLQTPAAAATELTIPLAGPRYPWQRALPAPAPRPAVLAD